MTNNSELKSKLKKILTESGIIVFSVLLALFANEWRSNVKENKHTQLILENIRLELKDNERIAIKAIAYHKSVFLNLNAAIEKSDSLESNFFNGAYFDDQQFAPNGIMREGFNDIAWVVAKEERIATRITFKQSEALYEAYNQQKTVEITLNRISDLLYNRVTHRKSSIKENVVLLGLIFHELVSQEEELLRKYKQVWKVIGKPGS